MIIYKQKQIKYLGYIINYYNITLCYIKDDRPSSYTYSYPPYIFR